LALDQSGRLLDPSEVARMTMMQGDESDQPA